jgi:hypothetical protein
VDSRDSIAIIAGIIIVIFVAIMVNSEYLTALQHHVPVAVPTGEVSRSPAPDATTPLLSDPITVILPDIAESQDLPHRISYTDKPYTYPSYRIPDHMETFGASEILPKTQEWVPFAFVEGSRGGLTEVFSVPYPVWVINSTVIAGTHPQYGIFRMVLCYADSGGIIDGEEILNQGKSYRIIQTSNTPVYMIISTENIDSFYLRLETPKNYYEAYHPA